MQLTDIDLTNPDTFQLGTPHEMFRLLRREAPVFWHEEDRRHIYEIGNKMVGFDDPEYHPDGKQVEDMRAQEAFREMFMYADKLREKARKFPKDDLATGLINAELDGERLSDMDFNFF